MVLLFLILILQIPPLCSAEEIILEHADKAEYIIKEKNITLIGNARLRYKDTLLQGDCVKLELYDKKVVARGGVSLQDKEKKIFGCEATYNLIEGTGEIREASTFIKPLYCKGEKIRFREGKLKVRNATLTTCNLPIPHYTLRAKEVYIRPKERLRAKSVTFYLRSIPIFYLPFYWRTLGERRAKLIIKPGYGKKNGWILRCTYHYFPYRNSKISFYLDYLQRKGLGVGGRCKYLSERDKGLNTYLYYISERENSERKKRWELRARYYQRVFKNTICRANLNFVSDKLFSREYREEWLISPEQRINSHLSLTHTRGNFILRFVGERKYEWSEKKERFTLESEKLPHLSFLTKRLRVRSTPLYFTTESNLCRERTAESPSSLIGESKFKLMTRLGRGRLTFTPNTTLGLLLREEGDLSWNYSTELNLRGKLAPSSITLKYKLGENMNSLEGFVTTWLNKRLNMNVKTEYNFKERKFADLSHRLEYRNEGLKFRIETKYGISERKIKSIDASINLGKDTTFGLRTKYEVGDSLQVISRAAIKLPKWNLLFSLHYDFWGGKFKEGGLTLIRDLHCWESSFSLRCKQSLREIGKVETEISVRLNIKAYPKAKFTFSRKGGDTKIGFVDLF